MMLTHAPTAVAQGTIQMRPHQQHRKMIHLLSMTSACQECLKARKVQFCHENQYSLRMLSLRYIKNLIFPNGVSKQKKVA